MWIDPYKYHQLLMILAFPVKMVYRAEVSKFNLSPAAVSKMEGYKQLFSLWLIAKERK
jgi:hypothetical protein